MNGFGLLQGCDILILSPSEWQDNAVSNMQIAAILSDTNCVAYVETMGGRMPRLSEIRRVWNRLKRIFLGASKRNRKRGLDSRNVTILSPFAIPIHGNWFIDWLNRRMLLFQVRRLMAHLGMNCPIVWSFSPRWEPVVNKLDSCCVVFHCVDALQTYDVSSAFLAQFQRTVKSADIVFTPGVLLEQELKRLNPATYRIGHGCGLDHLEYHDGGVEPEDLKAVPEPRAIYAGTLANWVDYSLLKSVAESLTQISFVLIGYVHALAPRDQVEALCALPNVFPLGYKDFTELPRYYHGASVGIIPYQAQNEHIKYSTPTKFLDYLAAGLPAVSTCYPAAELMSHWVTCADTPEAFASAIEHALLNDSRGAIARRRAYARDHTWVRQVEKMSDCLRVCLSSSDT